MVLVQFSIRVLPTEITYQYSVYSIKRIYTCCDRWMGRIQIVKESLQVINTKSIRPLN